MPALQHNAAFERQLTVEAFERCPRLYQYLDEVRSGQLQEPERSQSLVLGILVHVGLAALWRGRKDGAGWLPSLALDAIDASRKDVDSETVETARAGVLQYAQQWAGARDGWEVLAVAPENEPPEDWCVLEDGFVAYPDLIVRTPQYPLLIVEHKTGSFNFNPAAFLGHAQFLTQGLAAQQRWQEPVFYMVDYLLKPRRSGTTWAFPATPVWEMPQTQLDTAREWLRDRLTAMQALRQRKRPWPQHLSGCHTGFGLCPWYMLCFGDCVA